MRKKYMKQSYSYTHHRVNVSDALKREVQTTVSHLHKNILNLLIRKIFGVHTFSSTENLRWKQTKNIGYSSYCTEVINCLSSMLNVHVPSSNLVGLMSTPMIRAAPAFLHPIMTARPTAPRPHTAQVEPGSTFAVFRAAP